MRAHASRPTSCSRSSTIGRRSTSRRPAQAPRSTPERARLPRPPCLPPARVTVACAYVRLGGCNLSRPFPPCGRGRERSLSWGAGASPAIAHWAAAGPLQKVRSSPRASNSPHVCLILTFCLPLLPSVWPCVCPAAPHSRSHSPTSASTAAVSTPRPQPQLQPAPSRVFSGPVAASSVDQPHAFGCFSGVIGCESMCNGLRGGAGRRPAAWVRVGDAYGTYYVKKVHQSRLGGRPCTAPESISRADEKKG